MQTFLPYPDFTRSLECLDRQRLGKQRVEAYQIALLLYLHCPFHGGSGDPSYCPTCCGTKGRPAWRNHPAVRMWRGRENALVLYGLLATDAWKARGYADTLEAKFLELYIVGDPRYHVLGPEMPSWFGDDRFHASHRSNLLRKDPVYYGQFGWSEPPDLPYYWPLPSGARR